MLYFNSFWQFQIFTNRKHELVVWIIYLNVLRFNSSKLGIIHIQTNDLRNSLRIKLFDLLYQLSLESMYHFLLQSDIAFINIYYCITELTFLYLNIFLFYSESILALMSAIYVTTISLVFLLLIFAIGHKALIIIFSNGKIK